MTDTVNEEAMTPMLGTYLPSTAEVAGNLVGQLFSHGVNLEEHVQSEREQHLVTRQRMRRMRGELDALYVADMRKGNEIEELRDLLSDAWGVIANAGWDQASPEWVEAAERWRDRWHAVQPAQTDAQPTEAVNPTCTKAGHLTSSCDHVGRNPQRQTEGLPMPEPTCKCPRSEFGTTVCSTATTPPTSAG